MNRNGLFTGSKWKKMGVAKSQGGMGFRDLESFNKALLAKQCWRILQNPDSLVAKIFKAKYFPRGSILTAQLGRRPSYVWKSLWAAQDLLKAGIKWRVGNGFQIRIWKDRWLPQQLVLPTGLHKEDSSAR
jgi:hypothetical protein